MSEVREEDYSAVGEVLLEWRSRSTRQRCSMRLVRRWPSLASAPYLGLLLCRLLVTSAVERVPCRASSDAFAPETPQIEPQP
jgi:hypothetical protein